MNIQKFTQKSIEAVNDCEKLAYDYGNQEIEQEHLLVALLSQEDGLIPKLIDKMEINVEHFTENAKRHLAARTKVSGSSAQVYVGNDLNKVLIHAEDEAKAMGDEYVSVEHLFLCLLKYPNKAMKELMSFKPSGTSPFTIRCASPSTTAVLPTPGSPISTGLFLVLRERIRTTFRISSSRPITGSSFCCLARSTMS